MILTYGLASTPKNSCWQVCQARNTLLVQAGLQPVVQTQYEVVVQCTTDNAKRIDSSSKKTTVERPGCATEEVKAVQQDLCVAPQQFAFE